MKDLLPYVLLFLYLPTGGLNVELHRERRRVIGTEGGGVALPDDYTDTTTVSWKTGYYDYNFEHPAMFEANQCGGESRRVFSVPGEDVTLPAGYGANTAIIWVKLDDGLDKTAIAETEPGKPVLIKKDRYNGRLKAAADGSLIIINVTGFQSGHYGAFIERQQSLQCVQDYHLFVYYVHSIPACGEKIAVSGIEGGEVTLPVVQTDIREVTWSTLVDHMDEISP
ncbi:uncharacterized protein LOC143981304, partial [Lithobates pipiens]